MSPARSSETRSGDGDTIVAIATPPGRGGVGIVRISGPAAIAIAEQLGRRKFLARQAAFTRFRARSGEVLDEGITLVFDAGASFTGEAVAELQGHGGPLVLQGLVRAVLAEGARLARPGEFSERAFLNGRMDLAQAEAVADLIASGSEAAVRGALRSLSGAFSRHVDVLAGSLRDMRVRVEAGIDFPEDDLEAELVELTLSGLAQVSDALARVLKSARQGVRLSQGALVALVGSPNVGKSSLLNALAGEDAAIVTAIPGTTRDVVRVDLELAGLPIRLLDTAGLRVSDDPVEQEGIRRARDLLPTADLVLWVKDASETIPDVLPAEWLKPSKRVLTVGNKADLAEGDPSQYDLLVSARTGEGLDDLIRAITGSVGFEPDSSAFTARQRHVDLLESCASHLDAATLLLAEGHGLELVAEELRLAHDELGRIVGHVSADELLGAIFSTFCIGK